MTELKGVGPRVAGRLAKLGVRTVQDLLFHLPLRYEDRTRVVPIGTLRPGDQAVVEGSVAVTDVQFGRRRALLSQVDDGTGVITLRFFHFTAAQRSGLARGTRVRCFGEVRKGPTTLEMIHPEYQRLHGEDPVPVEDHLTPVYPTTSGLHQLSLRALTERALPFGEQLTEWLPESLRGRWRLPPLCEAVVLVHRPPPDVSAEQLRSGQHPAVQRLAFEELLAHHLSLRRLRERYRRKVATPVQTQALMQRLIDSLPFALTDAQRRVVEEIAADMAQPYPMQRLVQGDVGSGKTVVAACAALRAVEAGHQVAIMAPTELLSEQLYKNFAHWLGPLGVEVIWLSGSLKGRAREALRARVGVGDASVVVGTHALFQEGVTFANLGLVVIDEQHRFGVHQRLALLEKGNREGRFPHQLVMTATPIPRTLVMSFYADLDSSRLDEKPPGRQPITTVVVPDTRRHEVVERVHNACRAGHQAYWVCTLIEESEALACQAAENTAASLRQAIPDLRIGLVHGRMKQRDKERVMAAFKDNTIDVLVATTVVEVGVDVPNASLMIIDNAERLGLAQLHQLRGRVGRGDAESSCVLMYRGPLSEVARQRLKVLRETDDGFKIAERDLDLRGPGEVLGTRQTGAMQLRIADLQRDRRLVPQVEQAATVVLRDYPGHVEPLIQRWLREDTRYGDV